MQHTQSTGKRNHTTRGHLALATATTSLSSSEASKYTVREPLQPPNRAGPRAQGTQEHEGPVGLYTKIDSVPHTQGFGCTVAQSAAVIIHGHWPAGLPGRTAPAPKASMQRLYTSYLVCRCSVSMDALHGWAWPWPRRMHRIGGVT